MMTRAFLGSAQHAGKRPVDDFGGRVSDAHHKYFVVRHQGQWSIKHAGRHSIPYRTQKEAIQGALSRIRRAEGGGKNAQILVQDKQHTFRTEWTYGMDPYPPKG
jgi:hypothetical protein